jgi:HEAT repeat protein
LLLGAAIIACAVGMTLMRFPRFKTTDTLLTTARFRSEEHAELVRRGPEAVDRIVSSLHEADPEEVKIYENGINGGVMANLQLLGEIGGPDAVAELRAWLNRDCAPDIRSRAARALANAGDKESARDIGPLLENNTYEWRKEYIPLIHALAELKATDETRYIRSALMNEMGDGQSNTNLLTLDAAISALIAFDTPEAWQVITEMGNVGDEFHRQQVRRMVKERGREFPEAETTGGFR